MELEEKIKTLKSLKTIFIVIAGVYLALFFVDWLRPSIFQKVDPIFSFLPEVFNTVFEAQADFGYRQIPMGYVFTSVFFIILFLICKPVIAIMENVKPKEEEKVYRKKAIAEKQIKNLEERQALKKSQYKNMFFGMLEFNLQYSDNYNKDEAALEILRFEYYKILVSKLKAKYRSVNFYVGDKICFVSDNFSYMSSVTKDVLKILDIIIRINKQNQMKVNMLFSYWIDDRGANKKSIFKTLSKINELGNINKIIIPNEVYLKIISLGREPWCTVRSIGSVTLFNAYNNADIDVELMEMTSLK